MPEKKISSVIMIQHQDQIIHDVRRGGIKKNYIPARTCSRQWSLLITTKSRKTDVIRH